MDFTIFMQETWIFCEINRGEILPQLISNSSIRLLDFLNILSLDTARTLCTTQRLNQLLRHQRNKDEGGTVCPHCTHDLQPENQTDHCRTI